MGTIKLKVERSDFSEGLMWSLDGLSIVGNVVQKEEKFASMPFHEKINI
jgi:hypothetical protein